jgi:hypothetical protein
MVAGLALIVHPASTRAGAAAPQTQIPADILILKLSPGKWFYEVEGDVRSIETTSFRLEVKNGRTVETRLGSKTSWFDRRGRETELIEGEEARTVWKYDALGWPSEMIMYLAGAPLMREVYSYELNQRKLTTEAYALEGGRLHSRTVAFFDERWNQTRQETEFFETTGGGSLKDVVVYTQKYDSQGRVIFSTVGGEGGSISHRVAEEYSDSNYPLKGIYYSYDRANGALLSKSVNLYDGRGHLIENLYYSPRGQLLRRETYTREYDARGNWITERQVIRDTGAGRPPTSFAFVKRRKLTFY